MDSTGVSNISTVSFSEIIIEDFARVESLFPARALSTYTSFFDVFAASVTSFYGFEISLAKDEDLPDVLFCVHKPEELTGFIDVHRQLLATDLNFLNRLEKFIYDWQHNKRHQVSNVWFEYDSEEIVNQNYVPNFFIGPSQGLHPMETFVLIDELFATSFIDKNAYPNLLNCYRNLPDKAWVSQIGRMVARNESNYRVFIQDMPMGSIPDFLEAIGYTGKLHLNFLSWLEVANKWGQKVDLDLDVSKEISPKIGVEIYCQSMSEAELMLTEFYNQGLCSKLNFQKLKSHFSSIFCGEDVERYHFLSHFKLVYDGHDGFAAKAYLGFINDDQRNYAAGTKP